MSDMEDNIRLCEYRRYGTSGEWRPVQRDTKIAELLQRAEARVKELERDVMIREGYIETLEAIIAKTKIAINGITISGKRK